MKTKQQSAPKLATALGISEVYLKREDEHKYGSHKGRSIPLMIKTAVKEGIRDFVISSSGNAALAAVLATVAHNQNNPDKQITLRVFVGQNIEQHKLEFLQKRITDQHILLEQVERPKQAAFQLDKEGAATSLRQSTDDTALLGYEELAKDLSKIPQLAAVFVGTSSGTTAQGIGEAFARMDNKAQIHIVQTAACHPIAEALGVQAPTAERSIAGAIVDKVAHRKNAVVQVVQQSNGAAWVVTDDEIKAARELVKETLNIQISNNSALSVAGLQKAIRNGFTWEGPVVVLICGR